jgi:hypothetical protein
MFSRSYAGITGIFILFVSLFWSCALCQTTDHDRLDKKYAIIISGSWNSLNNRKLNNDCIDGWIAGDYLDHRIKSGQGLTAEILYYLSVRLSVSGGFAYIYGATQKDRTIVTYSGSDTTDTRDYVKTRIFAPSFSIRYYMHMEKIDCFIGISESYLFGKASRKITFLLPIGPPISTIKNEYFASGFGFQIFGGIQHILNNTILISISAGYRHLEPGI